MDSVAERVSWGNLNAITGELIKMAAAETELQIVLLNAGKGRECEHITIYMKKRREQNKNENENATRDEKKHSTCAKSKVRCEFGNLLRIYSAQICSLLQRRQRVTAKGGWG